MTVKKVHIILTQKTYGFLPKIKWIMICEYTVCAEYWEHGKCCRKVILENFSNN
jgi:hypothetical protein